MKNLAKICLIILIASSFGVTAEAKKKKKENKLSNLSQETIEAMLLEQNLVNLEASEYNFFESAVYNFEKMGEDAVAPLLEHLKNNRNDPSVVNSVIYTLGRLKKNGARAVPILMTYLKNSDYDTKVTTVSALGKIGKPAEMAIPKLKALLYDDEDWLTKVTKRTLKDIGTPMATAALEEYKKYVLLKKKRKELNKNKVN